MAKRHLRLVTPATVNRTVAPTRRPNADLRTREYLTEAEVQRLMKAARGNRWGHRDATMLLVAFRHGLRASELVDLRVGAGGVQDGHPARPESQTGHPQQPPDPRGRAACSAAVAARAGAEVNVRVHLGAERAVQHCRVRPDGGAGREESQAGLQGSPAHAQACLRVCAGQQRARHKGAASLSWTREYPAYCALHRAIADAI
jgi:hypothetical protein